MNISLDKLAPPVAFVIVGFTMAIVGATGVVPLFSPQLTLGNSFLQAMFMFLGVGLIIAGPIFLWRQPPSSSDSGGEDATKERSRNESSAEFFGIQVLKPADDEEPGNSFEIIGNYKNLPKGYSIWICTYSEEGENRQYWPQINRVEIDYAGKKGFWRGGMGWLGGDKGDNMKFLVFVTGEDGDALFSYFQKAGLENNKTVKEKTGQNLQLWPSIKKITKDTTLCATVRVRI